jgi:hypothetical protein
MRTYEVSQRQNSSFYKESTLMKSKIALPIDFLPNIKKDYEVPELTELGDVAKLTNYDVSVQVP